MLLLSIVARSVITIAMQGDVGIITQASPKTTANRHGLLILVIVIMVEAVQCKPAPLLALAKETGLTGNVLRHGNEVSHNL